MADKEVKSLLKAARSTLDKSTKRRSNIVKLVEWFWADREGK